MCAPSNLYNHYLLMLKSALTPKCVFELQNMSSAQAYSWCFKISRSVLFNFQLERSCRPRQYKCVCVCYCVHLLMCMFVYGWHQLLFYAQKPLDEWMTDTQTTLVIQVYGSLNEASQLFNQKVHKSVTIQTL